MKKLFLLLSPLILVALACNISSTPTVTPGITDTASPEVGTVTANLSYPASSLPAMRVAFFSLPGGSPSFVDTVAGQSSVSMDLPAGDYHVVSYSLGGEGFPAGLAGGYTQAVPCGLSVDCTDHTLITLTVVAGAPVSVNPGDWYAADGSFPPMPGP